jgi:hypothetical protein
MRCLFLTVPAVCILAMARRTAMPSEQFSAGSFKRHIRRTDRAGSTGRPPSATEGALVRQAPCAEGNRKGVKGGDFSGRQRLHCSPYSLALALKVDRSFRSHGEPLCSRIPFARGADTRSSRLHSRSNHAIGFFARTACTPPKWFPHRGTLELGRPDEPFISEISFWPSL